MRLRLIAAIAMVVATTLLSAPAAGPKKMSPGIWTPDQGDGTYVNPVLNGDYSDPDVVRASDDFYLTSSSFVNVPGLPVLHSKDLVNWTIIGHALPEIYPIAHYDVPRHGGGVWAPAIRYRGSKFYIYYPDPDFGIFVVTALHPAGPWTRPALVNAAPGAIDPCPFWDDDGKAYLVHAWAASRAGFANIITLRRLSPDGLKVIGERHDIVKADDLPPAGTSGGPRPWRTTEGPKLYKRNGYYYVFAPSGGVKAGFQGVLRSRSITGPYEGRDVLDQGSTEINGPHQGAWVTTAFGEDWFLHFQDTDAYGRRVWLEPMTWTHDWPVIGKRQGDHEYGEPVLRFRKPRTAAPQPVAVPIVNDDFTHSLHAGWQWNANPRDDWADLVNRPGYLRLKSISGSANLYEAGNILLQKLPGETFNVTAKMNLVPKSQGERAGLIVYGYNYAWIGLEYTGKAVRLAQATRLKANEAGPETETFADTPIDGDVYVRAHVEPAPIGEASGSRSTWAKVVFSYSVDGAVWQLLGGDMTALPGRWVGARMGLFAQAPSGTPSNVATRVGWADFDSFVVTP